MSASPLEGVRLVALDLDGTLLPSHKRISDRAKRVVRDLADAGITTVIATGRGWNSAAGYARELGLTGPIVTFEGALVAFAAGEAEEHVRSGAAARAAAAAPRSSGATAALPAHADTRRFLHHRTLSADHLRRAVHAIQDLHLGYFVCTDAGRIVTSRRVLEARLDQVAIWDQNVHFVDAWIETAERGYILHFVGPPADVREARARIHALLLDDVETFHADFWDGYEQFQIRPRGIGKHVGLGHVLDHLGLTTEHLLAAGDWHNDLEMLRMARVAVAPGNAVDAIREIAGHVLEGTCDDDAVIAFLDEALRGR